MKTKNYVLSAVFPDNHLQSTYIFLIPIHTLILEINMGIFMFHYIWAVNSFIMQHGLR